MNAPILEVTSCYSEVLALALTARDALGIAECGVPRTGYPVGSNDDEQVAAEWLSWWQELLQLASNEKGIVALNSPSDAAQLMPTAMKLRQALDTLAARVEPWCRRWRDAELEATAVLERGEYPPLARVWRQQVS